jgi:hypothetical protein
MTSTADLCRLTVCAALLLAAATVPLQHAEAQAPQTDARWHAWLGCWEGSAIGAPEEPPGPTETVCVLPVAGASSVEAVSIVDGVVVEREVLDASGARRPMERDGCTGWESMQWSEDGRRLFTRAEFECAATLHHLSTGVLAILSGGEWLSSHSMTAGENSQVRVLRYRSIQPERVGAEFAAALGGRGMAVEAARMAAASRLTVEHLIEAAGQVEGGAIEAWLIEQGQGFAIDATGLMALADAGVPDRVIDLVVALSHPDVFAVSRAAREGHLRGDGGRSVAPPRRPVRGGVMGPSFYPGYGWGGGYGGYGGYYPRGYYPPVVVVRDGGSRNQGGRLVSGRGYSQGSGSSGTNSPPAASTGGGSRPSTSASPGSGSGSGSSGSESRTGRRAQPRSGS